MNDMNLAKHCVLCDNQIVTFKDGTICSLTNKKPEFNKTCFKIEFNEKFEEKIKTTNLSVENIKRKKFDYYGSFVLFLCIGMGLIIGGYFIGKYVFDKGFISTVPLIIMGAGILPLSYAFGFFNTYNNERAIAEQNKVELDTILNLYKISYDIDFEYQKEIHGSQEVKVELKVKS